LAPDAPVEALEAGAGADDVLFFVGDDVDFDAVDFVEDFLVVLFHVVLFVDPPEDRLTETPLPLAMAAAWAWSAATVDRSLATCTVLVLTAERRARTIGSTVAVGVAVVAFGVEAVAGW
jgi:hypothetical protein